jgi:hypothetical protein
MVLLMKMEKYSVKIGLGYFAVSTFYFSKGRTKNVLSILKQSFLPPGNVELEKN